MDSQRERKGWREHAVKQWTHSLKVTAAPPAQADSSPWLGRAQPSVRGLLPQRRGLQATGRSRLATMAREDSRKRRRAALGIMQACTAILRVASLPEQRTGMNVLPRNQRWFFNCVDAVPGDSQFLRFLRLRSCAHLDLPSADIADQGLVSSIQSPGNFLTHACQGCFLPACGRVQSRLQDATDVRSSGHCVHRGASGNDPALPGYRCVFLHHSTSPSVL